MAAIKQTIPGNWDYQDEETIADVSSSTALNSTKAAAADAVIISAHTKAITVRASGSDATATVGIPIAAGSYELFNIAQLANLRIIEQESTAAVHVTYLKARSAS